MKLYVAGPMRGYENFNHQAFRDAAAALRALGHEVFNPVEHSEGIYGAHIYTNNPKGCDDVAGIDGRVVFAADLAFICTHADGVVMLPGWVRSKGANAEVATAIALNLRLFHYTEADPLVEVSKADRPTTAFAEAS